MSTNPEFGRGEGSTGGEKSKSGKNPSQESGSSSGRGGRLEGLGGTRTEELRDELHHVGEVAKDAAYEQMENLRARGLEKAHQLEDRIVDQPLKSVAIAAGIGFVVGLMWMRR